MSEQPTILKVQNLRIRANEPAINTEVRRGEIVGLAGLDGHGQEEFLEALGGLYKPLSGEVQVRGENGQYTPVRDFHGAVDAGIAYLPRNRKTEGILPPLSVLDNFTISTLRQSSRFGILKRGEQRKRLEYYQGRLGIVYASPSARITSLSGGNQQKVLLARWMAANPRVMLLNDPTRGVDYPTRMKLYEVFREMVASDGTTLVVLSTEIEELLQLCTRTLVFRDGAVFTELNHEVMTMNNIIAAMFGRDHHGEQ